MAKVLCLSAIVSATIGASACKPTASQVVAADNFAGSSAIHECRGTSDVSKHLVMEGPEALRPEIEAAMSSIPTGLQEIFFKTLGGKIEVSSEAQKRCSGSKMGKSGSKAISCWLKGTNGPVIAINTTTNDIRQATVRAFGYFIAEHWFKGSELYPVKVDVGKGLLADVARNKNYDLSYFAYQLDGTVLEKGLGDDERNARLDNLPPPLHSVARDVFYNFSFAEVFDSYFCNDTTKAMLASGREFSSAGAAFEPTAEMLKNLTAKDPPQEGTAVGNDSGNLNLSHGLAPLENRRYKYIWGNITISRGTGLRTDPTPRLQSSVVASSQYGTTPQINYTLPGSYSGIASYGGAMYKQQPDGSYGWYPKDAPANFKPTYFCRFNRTTGVWNYYGSTALSTLRLSAAIPQTQMTTSPIAVNEMIAASGTIGMPGCVNCVNGVRDVTKMTDAEYSSYLASKGIVGGMTGGSSPEMQSAHKMTDAEYNAFIARNGDVVEVNQMSDAEYNAFLARNGVVGGMAGNVAPMGGIQIEIQSGCAACPPGVAVQTGVAP